MPLCGCQHRTKVGRSDRSFRQGEHDLAVVLEQPLRAEQRDPHETAIYRIADVMPLGDALELDCGARVTDVRLQHVALGVVDDAVERYSPESERHGSRLLPKAVVTLPSSPKKCTTTWSHRAGPAPAAAVSTLRTWLSCDTSTYCGVHTG